MFILTSLQNGWGEPYNFPFSIFMRIYLNIAIISSFFILRQIIIIINIIIRFNHFWL